MSQTKRALLIASPFQGLRGPMNDVRNMKQILKKTGFKISQLCGPEATRDAIISAWQELIRESSSGDTVVIYYSGHGGLVEKPQGSDIALEQLDFDVPSRYQFIVPMDYDENTGRHFRGILDVELSHMLRDTTERTDNVTAIFDCCHSGRMSRDPIHGANALPRGLPEVHHHNITEHLRDLRGQGLFQGETHLEGNPLAVRLTASDTTEVAWEYQNKNGEFTGAFTEALAHAIDEANGHEVSWRTTIARVRDLVSIMFPQQHPQVEGPDTRLQFSLRQMVSGAIHISLEDDAPVLQAGRVAGVQEGNTYVVMPFGSERPDSRQELAEAEVVRLNGFKAEIRLKFSGNHRSIPPEGAMAFLRKAAPIRLPITIPGSLLGLEELVEASQFLRSRDRDEDVGALAEFRQENGFVILHTSQGVEIASSPTGDGKISKQSLETLVTAAEKLAQGQRLLTLKCETSEEALAHDTIVEFGLVENGRRGRTIRQDGTDYVTEKDSVYISLLNQGKFMVYVSVFDVNVSGKISLISASHPKGIPLDAGGTYTLGRDQFGQGLRGLQASWPLDVSKESSIGERWVLIFSSLKADLRNLADQGVNRDFAEFRCSSNQYDVLQIPFSLRPRALPARDLPELETTPEYHSLRVNFPEFEIDTRGLFEAGIRKMKGIPSCVWVVNEHREEITVIVSKYRPNRMLLGAEASGSPVGAGLGYSMTTFVSPAARKTLSPKGSDGGHTAVFPLWTRKEGFGVISIFRGAELVPFIENDRVPLGAIVYFTNRPDLDIAEYGSKMDRESERGP